MATLVTGSNGFAGINIVRKLAEAGESVVGLDNSPPSPDTHKFLGGLSDKVRFISADIVDSEQVLNIAKDNHIQRFVHAAALTPTLEFEQSQTRRMLDVNLMGTINVLEAARKTLATRFVFVSSSGVYGAPNDRKAVVKENSMLQLDKLYTICKYSSELIVKRYSTLFGLSTVIGRMCAIYGPMEKVSTSRANPSMIYKLVAALLAGRRIRARGRDLVNDYTHSQDAASIWSKLTLTKDLAHDIYNVSAGIAYSLGDVLTTIQEINADFRYEFVNDNEDADVEITKDGERGALDISRAKTNFDFVPKYDLKQGIQDYINWSKEYPNQSPMVG